MSRLADAIKSVPAGSSPADEEVLDPNLDLELNADPAGEAGDGEDEQDEKKERTAENVRGELLRKMNKSNQEMLAELKAIREENSRLREHVQAPVPVPTAAPSQPQTLDDMSVEQLVAMQATVPAEQRPAFDAYLIERKVEAKVDEKLNKFQSTTQAEKLASEFDATAIERWPELRNKSSEFYGITDKILSEMGPAGQKEPRALLAAANEAGLQLGMQPAGGVRRAGRQPGNVAPGRSTRGTATSDPVQSDEDKKIANRLADAMPGRKFTEKQLKRIAKRDKLYKEALSSHIRG